MSDHRKLEVWQRAHALAVSMDAESRRIARGNAELADQLRRATLSIPANLAEGAARNRDSEFVRFISIALGSAAEADSLLAHASATRALECERCEALQDELTIIRKMLYNLRKKVAPLAVREQMQEHATLHPPPAAE